MNLEETKKDIIASDWLLNGKSIKFSENGWLGHLSNHFFLLVSVGGELKLNMEGPERPFYIIQKHTEGFDLLDEGGVLRHVLTRH
ncbi:MAG: hypothetical protein RIC35_00785 [Marinoscillum sp.]